MKYFFFALTCIYAFAAVATFWSAGADPFMNIMAFICLIGNGVFAWLTVWASETRAKTVPLEDNSDEPDWERIQNEPAYLRRD